MNAVEKEKEVLANARVGYQVAISAWINENRQNWDKTRIMLLFNSLLLAGVLKCNVEGGIYPYISLLLLCPFGWVICEIWHHIIKRGLEYNKYWILSAREIEERYLKGTVKTFSDGGHYADGKPINLFIDGEIKPLKMTTKFKVKKSIYVLIRIIALLYPAGAIFSIIKLSIEKQWIGIVVIFSIVAIALYSYLRWEISIQEYFSKKMKDEESLSIIIMKFLRKKITIKS